MRSGHPPAFCTCLSTSPQVVHSLLIRVKLYFNSAGNCNFQNHPVVSDRRTNERIDGQPLLQRWEDASKTFVFSVEGKLQQFGFHPCHFSAGRKSIWDGNQLWIMNIWTPLIFHILCKFAFFGRQRKARECWCCCCYCGRKQSGARRKTKSDWEARKKFSLSTTTRLSTFSSIKKKERNGKEEKQNRRKYCRQ